MVLGLVRAWGWAGLQVGGGPYRTGREAKRRGINLGPLQFSNVLRSRDESAPLWRGAKARCSHFLSLLPESHTCGWIQFQHNFQCAHVSFTESACVEITGTEMVKIFFFFFFKKGKEQEQQGTAAKYTHKEDSFWWYLQSHCEKRTETMTGSSSMGRDDLHICDYLIQISLRYRSRLGDSLSPRVDPSLLRRLQFLVSAFLADTPLLWACLEHFISPMRAVQ